MREKLARVIWQLQNKYEFNDNAQLIIVLRSILENESTSTIEEIFEAFR